MEGYDFNGELYERGSMMDGSSYEQIIKNLELELSMCMEQKNQLEDEVKWMHDMIWKLIKKSKY